MIYSLFDHRYSFCTVFWVSSFYLSVNIVVLYQFTVTCIETWSVRSLERRKGSKIAIVFSGRRRRWMDLWKQMSSKWSFTCICGIFLPLNSSATTVYARSAFYPSQQSSFCILHPACVLLSVCSLHFTLSQHFTPGPQSAVRSLFFTPADSPIAIISTRWNCHLQVKFFVVEFLVATHMFRKKQIVICIWCLRSPWDVK